MGPEKLDNTVYWIRGLYDLADMAQSKGDDATERWARAQGRPACARASRARGGCPRSGLHADSLGESNEKIQQQHWIGVHADGGRADASTAARCRA